MQSDRAFALRNARPGRDLLGGFQRRSNYLRQVLKRLGADQSHRPWPLTDYSMKLIRAMGKSRSLWRVRFLVHEVMPTVLDGENVKIVMAQLTQTAKALHQIALYLENTDLVTREICAGESHVAEIHFQWTRLMQTLMEKGRRKDLSSEASSEEVNGKGAKEKKKKKKN